MRLGSVEPNTVKTAIFTLRPIDCTLHLQIIHSRLLKKLFLLLFNNYLLILTVCQCECAPTCPLPALSNVFHSSCKHALLFFIRLHSLILFLRLLKSFPSSAVVRLQLAHRTAVPKPSEVRPSKFARTGCLKEDNFTSSIFVSTPQSPLLSRSSSSCGNGRSPSSRTVSRYLELRLIVLGIPWENPLHFLFKVSSSNQAVLFFFPLRGMTSAKTGLLGARQVCRGAK